MESFILTLDEQLFFIVNRHSSNALLDWLCPLLRNKFTWVPFYFLAAFYLTFKFKSKVLWIFAATAITVLIADQLAAGVIKSVFQRLRPCNEPSIKEHVRLLVNCGSGFSFVSAHAANHFAIASLFATSFSKKYLSLLLFIWASSVAFAQVYVGVHYPLDVILGGVLGTVIGYPMALILKRWQSLV